MPFGVLRDLRHSGHGFVAALLSASLLVSLLGGCHGATPPAERRPALCPGCNVILISLDTVRADHVGAYGYPKPTTPNVDALAAHAAVFDRAISQSSWTRASHMSIFTGLPPSGHGFKSLKDRHRLPDSVPTLASVLRSGGYRTAGFTGGVNVAGAFGFDAGFDTYRSNGKYLRDNLEDIRYWLDQHHGERFFLFVHGYEPHTPYLADPVDRIALGMRAKAPKRGLKDFCRRAREHRNIARFVDAYDAAIRRGDRYVGKLLAHLDKLGLRERSLIVFVSDHGEEFLEHGRCFHLTTLYGEVLHVPLVISGPGVEPGRIAATVPGSSSIAATIAEAVGIAGTPLPGFSLVPYLRGEPADPPEAVLSETSRSIEGGNGDGEVRALTTSRGKLIEWLTRGGTEYFDYATDPGEQLPLASGFEYEKLLARLRSENATKKTPAAQPAEDVVDRQLQEQLRSFGYVE